MRYIAPEESRTQIGNLKYFQNLRKLSRDNRKKPTKSEKLFWKLLNYQKMGLKFLRQKPIGRFILDFYCSKLLLAVEIDGDSHDRKKNYDDGRDLYLIQKGIKTIRFANNEVTDNIVNVKQNLLIAIEERKRELKF